MVWGAERCRCIWAIYLIRVANVNVVWVKCSPHTRISVSTFNEEQDLRFLKRSKTAVYHAFKVIWDQKEHTTKRAREMRACYKSSPSQILAEQCSEPLRPKYSGHMMMYLHSFVETHIGFHSVKWHLLEILSITETIQKTIMLSQYIQ